MNHRRGIITIVVAVLATVAVVVITVSGRSTDSETSTDSTTQSPVGPATTPTTNQTKLGFTPDETTSTTSYLPSSSYVGTISMTLQASEPGDHLVVVQWGPYVRRFNATTTKTAFCFDKKDAVGPPIGVSSTIGVEVTFAEGCPDGGVDARALWVKV